MLTEDVQNDIYERLGEAIKTARVKSGIKQELLADYLNLSRVSISNIEKGKQKIQLHTLLELAKYLRINLTELIEPLNSLLIDIVSSKQEKQIIKGLNNSISSETIPEEDTAKVKEFVNFLKSRNQK